MKRLLTFIFCIMLVVTAFGCGIKSKDPLTKNKPLVAKDRPVVTAYYVNDSSKFDPIPALKAHADLINEIHPLWYHVRADGSLKKEVDPLTISLTRQNGSKLIPLVNLVPSQDDVLLNQTSQDKTIANLIQEVKANNYDGLDIDFEFIPSSDHKDFSVDRDQLTLFMKKIHAQLNSLGKETHMAVLPHVGVPTGMQVVYDYGQLAPYLTKVALMCYDYKEAHSPPGPVAPFSWVEQNITTALKQGLRSEQISLGVATYGYDWPTGEPGGFARPTSNIIQQTTMNGYPVKWNDQYQEPYYTYTDDAGVAREVWFENDATLQTKMDLVDKYKLSGISIWRLGFEDQKFWNRIANNWGKK